MRPHKLSSTFFSLLALAILAAGSVFGAAPTFGMVGLGLGQTLRLNIVAFPPSPCSATIGVRDSNGNYPIPLPDKTVTLQPGQADFLDVNFNLVSSVILPLVNPTGARNRISLRPVVTLTNPGVGACVVTAEVIDNLTGFSVLGVQPQPEPDVPQSNPDFGMVGIALGQILRLNVVAFPPTPCSATLGFRGSNGNTPQPVPDKTVTLNPGQADFLDISAASLGVQFGHRVELRPVVTVLQTVSAASSAPSVCSASVEVYDPITGRTWAFSPMPLPDLPAVQ